MAAEQVIAHIRGLHVDFRNAAVHSKWLEQFQGAPESWAVALELLRSSNEEVIAHFAAHTLVTKLQVGHGQMLNGGGGLQDLLGCIAKFANGPKAVRRALAVGLVDYQLWRPPNEDMEWLRSCTMQMADPAQAACLLELLIAVPEEVKNRKVVIPGERRGSFAACMLQSFDLVLDALTKALQQTSDPQMTTLIMSAFARWLSLQHASPSLRMQRKAGQTSMYCADILSQRNLQDHPLVMQACATISNLATAPEELCHQAADVLIELLELTNEVSPKVRPVQLRIFQAILAGAREIMPAALQAYSEKFMPEELQLATRALMLSRLVSESAFTFARMWIQDGLAKESGPGSWVLAPAVMQELLCHSCTPVISDIEGPQALSSTAGTATSGASPLEVWVAGDVCRGCEAAAQMQFRGLSPLHLDDFDEVQCSICLMPLEDGDVLGRLPCGHLFHKACIVTWLERATLCPMRCRHPLQGDGSNTHVRWLTPNARRQRRQLQDDLHSVVVIVDLDDNAVAMHV